MSEFDAWLRHELVCPVDKLDFVGDREELVCPEGQRYQVVDGIPIMLVPDASHTRPAARQSLEYASSRTKLTKQIEASEISEHVDPFVQKTIVETHGRMYQDLIEKLEEYPIPTLRIPAVGGRQGHFLELGCNWGRWCIAAYQLGYLPVGIDPSLEAIRAAYRVARQLGVEARYIVGDARYLPFRNNTFSVVFSYSVVQHFDKADALLAFSEAGRVLNEGGFVMIQMANMFGVRSLYHQMRRGFRTTRDFEVRYWAPGEMKAAINHSIGPAELSADGYFSLNPQPSEAHLLPWRFRWVVSASELMRRLSSHLTLLKYLADSLYVVAFKAAPGGSKDVRT